MLHSESHSLGEGHLHNSVELLPLRGHSSSFVNPRTPMRSTVTMRARPCVAVTHATRCWINAGYRLISLSYLNSFHAPLTCTPLTTLHSPWTRSQRPPISLRRSPPLPLFLHAHLKPQTVTTRSYRRRHRRTALPPYGMVHPNNQSPRPPAHRAQ